MIGPGIPWPGQPAGSSPHPTTTTAWFRSRLLNTHDLPAAHATSLSSKTATYLQRALPTPIPLAMQVYRCAEPANATREAECTAGTERRSQHTRQRRVSAVQHEARLCSIRGTLWGSVFTRSGTGYRDYRRGRVQSCSAQQSSGGRSGCRCTRPCWRDTSPPAVPTAPRTSVQRYKGTVRGIT